MAHRRRPAAGCARTRAERPRVRTPATIPAIMASSSCGWVGGWSQPGTSDPASATNGVTGFPSWRDQVAGSGDAGGHDAGRLYERDPRPAELNLYRQYRAPGAQPAARRYVPAEPAAPSGARPDVHDEIRHADRELANFDRS